MFYVSEVFEPKIFIVWFGILMLILAYKKRFFEAGFLFFGTFGGQAIKTIVKHLTDKPRPENPFGIVDAESSFPSGHATASVFLFFAIYYLVTPYLRASWRPWVQGLLITGMFLVPFSRLFLQVHYTSDVLAGALLGTASFAFTLFIFDYFYKKTHENYPQSLEK
jgi:undecaprenyl-diphosphatase